MITQIILKAIQKNSPHNIHKKSSKPINNSHTKTNLSLLFGNVLVDTCISKPLFCDMNQLVKISERSVNYWLEQKLLQETIVSIDWTHCPKTYIVHVYYHFYCCIQIYFFSSSPTFCIFHHHDHNKTMIHAKFIHKYNDLLDWN